MWTAKFPGGNTGPSGAVMALVRALVRAFVRARQYGRNHVIKNGAEQNGHAHLTVAEANKKVA